MKNSFLGLLLIVSNYALAQLAPDYSIKPGRQTVIRINYHNNSKQRSIFSYVSNVLPVNSETRIEDSLPERSGDKYLVFELAAPQCGMFMIDNYGGNVYLVPNDTLVLSIDLTNNKVWQSYHFQGRYAKMSQYYFDKVNRLKCFPNYLRAHFANETNSLTHYSQQMDSLLRVEQQFLSKYIKENPLPTWFIKEEQQQILYCDAAYRTNGVNYRQFIKKDKLEDLPKNFFSFVTPTLLNNPAAAHLVDYQHFLKDFYMQRFFRQKKVSDATKYITEEVDKSLTGQAWDVFMTRYLDEILAGAPTTGEKLLAKYYSRFINKRWIAERKAYYQEAYTLKPGQIAPNFALTDKLDSLTYLKDYKGQVVYLSFWFTGCAPCRQEMPYENELVSYFSNKPVKVVSICVMSSPEDWAKVSNLHKLKTVNLYANKAWEKTLINKYNVKSYPHYMLIDQEGKVVKNNCSRPSSQQAKQEIEALLHQ